MVTVILLLFAALFAGLWRLEVLSSKKQAQTIETLRETLSTSEYWHNFYRVDATEKTKVIASLRAELKLQVKATVTGPNSMNITGSTLNPGGYRYDTNNS